MAKIIRDDDSWLADPSGAAYSLYNQSKGNEIMLINPKG